MKLFRLLAFAAIALTLGCASAAGQASGFDIGQNVHVVRTDRVSTYEIWNFAPVRRVSSGDAVVELNILDPEAPPLDGDHQVLAIVLVGQLGTGIEPVAFRISAPDTRPVTIVAGQDQSEGATFDLTVGDVVVPLVVRSGGRVALGRHDIGTIQ